MAKMLELLTTPHSPADVFSAVHPRLGVLLGGPPLRSPAETVPPDPDRAGSDTAGSDTAMTVRFSTSGLAAPIGESETLLEAAESAGLEPRTGCRRGVCHRCVSQLTEGVTRNSRDGLISAAGDTVRICVSTAMTDVEVEL